MLSFTDIATMTRTRIAIAGVLIRLACDFRNYGVGEDMRWIVRRIATALGFWSPCTSAYGHSFEYGWYMNPQSCRVCGMRHEDVSNWMEGDKKCIKK